jgi:predicted translation initiation factor SUI1
MALSAIKALHAMGVSAADDIARAPVQVTDADLERADRIVALKQSEHLPLLQERFPAWVEKVEFWQVDDAPEVLSLIEREVMDLMARLMGGGKRREASTPEIAAHAVDPVAQKKIIKTSAPVVRLGRETKGRRGKGVTTISELPLDEAGLVELAAMLKQRCGTGGTVKDGRIEIQGDQRNRLITLLEGMGYRVRRTGG